MHTLYTLYLIAAHNNIMNWAPCFFIVVEYPDQTDVYFGEMKHTGNIQDFDIVIEKYFGKTLWDLAFSLTWGGYLPNDVQIAKDLGLGYGVYKTSNIYGKSTHYEYLDYEFTDPSLEGTRFSGQLLKYDDITKAFELLEMTTNVHFTINQNTILIMKGKQ